ncbi:c-type cytochrome [Ponticaulis sp.]|uniref:c-type cytochrome n=1 Tax=Ponticaulis sp. TaxID=2020902 RepID=UPI0025CB9B85|nr:c-type cytochrome [Ponticaulis sp.]|tara:strand:- start:11542 stop:11934 length:393 start_codon:yes stop_codon:yes gene_type:complete
MHFRALIIPAILSFAAACSPATEPAEEPTAETPAVNDEMANLITEGRAIAEENCTSCHAIGATGASPRTDAPELRTVFREFDPEAISADFREGIHVGAPDMPDFDFGPLGTEALIAYLQSIQTEVPAQAQ